MRLGSFAPIACTALVIACSASALADALTTGPYPGDELAPSRLAIGWLATVTSLMLIIWLILDSREPARNWAKSALALLLVGAAMWSVVVWPSFWASLGLDVCPADCILEQHIVARADVVQGKWAIAFANVGAMCCVLAAIFHPTRHAA